MLQTWVYSWLTEIFPGFMLQYIKFTSQTLLSKATHFFNDSKASQSLEGPGGEIALLALGFEPVTF